MRTRRRQRGQELVELAIVAPVLFLIALGGLDLMRVVETASTVADAARQGARQAVANAASSDQPFGTVSGLCSGVTNTTAASGTGCLTDAAIKSTVNRVIAGNISGSTLYDASASGCPTPSAGKASICINPAETSRDTEWTTPTQQGSYIVSVTVIVNYSALTPVVAGIFPSAFVLSSTTSMVAEY